MRRSLTPNPSPNGEGSENHYLQIKRAFRHIEERLFWIGRKALLHLRRAFPYLLSYTRTPRNPILLSLRNTSLKQYVLMSFCLKKLYPYVLETMLLCLSTHSFGLQSEPFCHTSCGSSTIAHSEDNGRTTTYHVTTSIYLWTRTLHLVADNYRVLTT